MPVHSQWGVRRRVTIILSLEFLGGANIFQRRHSYTLYSQACRSISRAKLLKSKEYFPFKNREEHYIQVLYNVFRPQLIDAITASQTSEAQGALMGFLDFNEEYDIKLQERYLLAAAFSTHPHEALLRDLMVSHCLFGCNHALKDTT